MWMMLQNETPEDFVIATGESHSVREFVEAAFKHVGKEIVYVFLTSVKIIYGSIVSLSYTDNYIVC